MKQILFACIAVLLLASCKVTSKHTPPILGLQPSLSSELRIIGDPLVGQDVTLVVDVAAEPCPNCRFADSGSTLLDMTMKLPDGIELVSGDLHFTGDVKDGMRQQKQATIRVVREGTYHLSFLSSLYVDSYPDHAVVSTDPFRNEWSGSTVIQSFSQDLDADLVFAFSEPPALGKTVKLSVSATPREAIQQARLSIMLDQKGMKLISIDNVSKPTTQSEFTQPGGLDMTDTGQLSWRGDLAAGERLNIDLTVTTIASGSGTIGEYFSTNDGTAGKRLLYDIVVDHHGNVELNKTYDRMAQ